MPAYRWPGAPQPPAYQSPPAYPGYPSPPGYPPAQPAYQAPAAYRAPPPSTPDLLSGLSSEGPAEVTADNFDDIPQHIQVNPRYVATPQGVITILETIMATTSMLLYLLMASRVTYQWYAHMCFMLAFTYTLNNMLIIIAGMSSPSTQLYLPQTAFYVLFHLMAGLIYVVMGALLHLWDNDDDLPLRFVAGVRVGDRGVEPGPIRFNRGVAEDCWGARAATLANSSL
ncbi:uncharacterized protein LOC135398747 isoform X2 [Ornithodoros turicata]|uniref:uncharacterized protein LOC135398747 isoform X2 n=1 Tax=Ornithodoros turicata TaxID=34597 RepID=UPI00313A33FB